MQPARGGTLCLHGALIQELAGGGYQCKCSAHFLIPQNLITHKQPSNSSFEEGWLDWYAVYAPEKHRNGSEGGRNKKKLEGKGQRR